MEVFTNFLYYRHPTEELDILQYHCGNHSTFAKRSAYAENEVQIARCTPKYCKWHPGWKHWLMNDNKHI